MDLGMKTTQTWLHRILLAFIVLTLSGCGRGTWWYRHASSGEPYGIQSVLIEGTGALSPIAMADKIEECRFEKVYASYSVLTDVSDGVTAEANLVADFNAELHSRGISTQYLISDGWTGSDIDGSIILDDWTSLLAHIQDRVIAFNMAFASEPAKQFDAIHLDIEPQTAPVCKSSNTLYDGVACHAYFQNLLELVADVFGNQPKDFHLPVYVDLPVWLDKWETGSKVTWPAPAEVSRNEWFETLSVYASGITMMAYGNDDANNLWDSVSWEAANYNGDVRVGLDLDPSGAVPFPDWSSMYLMMLALAINYDIQVDFHSNNEIQAEGGCQN